MEKEYRKVSDLKEWAKNPRSITPEGLERLKKQLVKNKEEQGEWLYKPLIITNGGTVLGGNMRLKALRELKADTVWVSVVKADTVDKMLEIALSDNDRVGTYVFDELDSLVKEFPGIDWGMYAVDLQDPPTVTLIETPNFLDTLMDRLEISKLKTNKYSYRQHSQEQIDHLTKSIQQNGVYKNIVVAKDFTILDGHAVVRAAEGLGIKVVPVKVLDIEPDSEQALKIVVSNNELGRFAEVDDRKLTEILKDIKDKGDSGLLGTGYDNPKLANLLMVTRPQSEIGGMDDAAEMVGMPDYENEPERLRAVISFESEEDRDKFIKSIGIKVIAKKTRFVWSFWWPEKQKESLASKKYE